MTAYGELVMAAVSLSRLRHTTQQSIAPSPHVGVCRRASRSRTGWWSPSLRVRAVLPARSGKLRQTVPSSWSQRLAESRQSGRALPCPSSGSGPSSWHIRQTHRGGQLPERQRICSLCGEIKWWQARRVFHAVSLQLVFRASEIRAGVVGAGVLGAWSGRGVGAVTEPGRTAIADVGNAAGGRG